MEEQISNIITMLAALLTGGFLMLFIENLQIRGEMDDRYHKKLHPFFYSFTNYVKFIASFRTCYLWKQRNKNSENLNAVKDDIDEISRYGSEAIISGNNYSQYDFSSQNLENICNKINDIWYRIDRDYEGFKRNVTFDDKVAKNFSAPALEYLRKISPKYSKVTLTKDTISQISGDFYVDLYQPIQTVIPEYELWKRKEKIFRYFSISTIIITIFSMLFIMIIPIGISHRFYEFIGGYFPLLVSDVCIGKIPYALCLLCSGLLVYELFQLIKLENMANKLMRS